MKKRILVFLSLAHLLWPSFAEDPIQIRMLGEKSNVTLFIICIHVILGLSLLGFFMKKGCQSNLHRALFLLIVLVSFFFIMAVMIPYSQHYSWLAILLFLGFLAVFKLMTQFEKPKD